MLLRSVMWGRPRPINVRYDRQRSSRLLQGGVSNARGCSTSYGYARHLLGTGSQNLSVALATLFATSISIFDHHHQPLCSSSNTAHIWSPERPGSLGSSIADIRAAVVQQYLLFLRVVIFISSILSSLCITLLEHPRLVCSLLPADCGEVRCGGACRLVALQCTPASVQPQLGVKCTFCHRHTQQAAQVIGVGGR
jgi:hypothetical protein